MSVSLRTDFPILPTFPRSLPAATPTLARIAEQSQQQNTILTSSTTATSREVSTPNPNYTFVDSLSDSSSSLSSCDALPPLAHVPSCLDLEDLGYESADVSDWTVSWDVSSNVGGMGQEVKLLEQGDLSVIQDEDFTYYLKPGMKRWEEEDRDGSLKAARRRLEKRGRDKERGGGFRHFLKVLLGKMEWGSR